MHKSAECFRFGKRTVGERLHQVCKQWILLHWRKMTFSFFKYVRFSQLQPHKSAYFEVPETSPDVRPKSRIYDKPGRVSSSGPDEALIGSYRQCKLRALAFPYPSSKTNNLIN
ncbi:hypothetical protein AVEN_192530-1 [Araneus ventricosus]|uniref:Uncharacterized protein n=1 Tax=Araneus ventricosus TaxID=182803 RepID=A0A4Y1ZNU2_ARAVE|nr:hypothetical protein AVEN_192530-1 [Araneus ventricosus]